MSFIIISEENIDSNNNETQAKSWSSFVETDPTKGVREAYRALDELIDYNTDGDQVLNDFLSFYSYIYTPETVFFGEDNSIKVFVINIKGGEKYIIEDGFLKNAFNWIYDLNDWELQKYIPKKDFSETFWENPKFDVLYHATKEENVQEILQNGLRLENKTRGISNRGMGKAIFTSSDETQIDHYGAHVVEINVSKMKQDGYMPEVSKESVFEPEELRTEIAQRIQLEYKPKDYSNEGLSDETIVFWGEIPAKYLKLVS